MGLVAENATEMMRRDAKDFVDAGLKIGAAPYLGPIVMDTQGRPIQWLREEHLLSAPMERLIFREAVLLREFNRVQPALTEGEAAGCMEAEAGKG